MSASAPRSIRVSTAWWRCTSTSRRRSGRCSHRRSRRPPIGVTVLSSTPSRVLRVSPSTRVSSSSGGGWRRSSQSPRRRFPSRSRSGAAGAASGFPRHSRAGRLRRRSRAACRRCRSRSGHAAKKASSWRRPLSASNSQGARRRTPVRWRRNSGQFSSSGTSSSAGSSRASSASRGVVGLHFVDQEAATSEVGPGQAVALLGA